MFRPRSRQLRRIATLLSVLGIVLLVVGGMVGWVAPPLACPASRKVYLTWASPIIRLPSSTSAATWVPILRRSP